MQLQVVYTEAFELPWLFRRKVLDSTPSKRATTWFWCICWRQQKLIISQRNIAATRVWLELVAPAIYIIVIFILLIGLRVWDDWLESGRTNLCRTCHCARVFFGVTSRSRSFFLVISKLVWSPCPAERGRVFLQAQEPDTLAAEGNLVSSNWASPNGLADSLGLEKLEL